MAHPKRRLLRRGFTLLELMIVVAILGILASIALPKFADMLRRSQEGNVVGNLGTIRSAIGIYFADNNGANPNCVVGPNSGVLTNALIPRYIAAIPSLNSGLHPTVSSVYCDAAMVAGSIHDSQGWYFDGALPADSDNGGVWVACDHTDIAGHIWTTY